MLDIETGTLIDDKIGLPNQVIFEVPLNYGADIITVHNHPSNTPPFSEKLDIFTKQTATYFKWDYREEN